MERGGRGTNAVGTALAAEHAVQVFAAEHFTEPVQRWTCAAAPVNDPDTGQLLGVIDLTGDMNGVHPHSLSVVVATARAVEQLLAARMHELDEARRARYAALLGPASAGGALVTATGRVILDRTGGVLRDIGLIPPGGGGIVLPSGVEAIAEPLEDGDAYLVRPRAQRVRVVRPVLELHVLGGEAPEVRLDGRAVPLRRRHTELLTLLTLHRGPVGRRRALRGALRR